MDNKISPRENFLLSQRNAIADRLKALSEDQTPNKCKEAELERLRRRMAELDAELWPDGNKTEEMPWANNDNSCMSCNDAKADDSLSESDLRELGRKDAQESPWKAYSAYMSGKPSWRPDGITYEDASQDGTDWKSWEDAVKEDSARKCSGGEILDVPNKIIMKHAGEPMTECNWERIYAEFVAEMRNERRNRYMDTDVRKVFDGGNEW